MVRKPIRRQRIVELLESQPVHNQEHLRSLLAAAGIQTTQATLSRDLRDLGVVKGQSGYTIPGTTNGPRNTAKELERSLQMYLLSSERGGNLVVLRTAPGHAQALAVELDRAQLRGVLGTVAGDDTVFVASKSATSAGTLAHLIRKLAKLT